MSDLDLQIDVLRLDVSNVEGQRHRIGPITKRAAAIFAERLAEEWPVDPNGTGPKTTKVNLGRMGDEEAAQAIAENWIRSAALKLTV